MSIEFFRKLNWAFGLIALGTVFGITTFAAMIEIKDLDLWLHLRMGQYIAQHGFVPSFDVLSASFFGKPWVDHEWLFQLILHGVRSVWGLDGLIHMQAGIVLITFLIMLLLVYDKDRQLIYVPFLFLVMQVYQTRFTIRPDIFSVFFLVLYLWLMSSYLRSRWLPGLMLLLQAIWSNIHGYSLWGIGIVLIALFAETLKRRVPLPWEWNTSGRLDDHEYKRLAWIAVLLLLASFFNPFGIKGTLYPWQTLLGMAGDSRIFFSHITELQRPLCWGSLFDLGNQGPFKELILLSAIGFVFNRRKLDLGALFLWLAFLLFALTALRNMAYFAVISFVVTGYNFSGLRFHDIVPFRFSNEKLFQLSGAIIGIVLTVYLVDYGSALADRGYYDFDRYERKSEFLGVSERLFPAQAARFLVDHHIRGNFFNDFNSGAYLIGHVYPDIMVFMDGRTELRGGAFFREYQEIWSDGNGKAFDSAARRYGLTGIFANSSGAPASDKFLSMIAARPEWKPVYFDYDAIIFLKDVPANRQWIDVLGIDLKKWVPKELDLQKVGSSPVTPYQNIRRAKTLQSLGFYDQALAEAEAALRVMPSYDEAYKVSGDIAVKRHDKQKAFEDFRLACAYNGGNAVYRRDLALAYLALGNAAKGLEQAEKAVSFDGGDAESRYVLAKALLKNKQYQKGCDILKQLSTQKKTNNELKGRVERLLNEIKGDGKEKNSL